MEAFIIAYLIAGFTLYFDGLPNDRAVHVDYMAEALALVVVCLVWLPSVVACVITGGSIDSSCYARKMRARRQSDLELYGC